MKNNEVSLDGKYITADEFRQRMGWKSMRNVYVTIADKRIMGAIKVGHEWLIPANAVPIDLRSYRKKKKPFREYLFVMDGVELWVERGYLFLYDQHSMIKEKDTSENRAKLLQICKEF